MDNLPLEGLEGNVYTLPAGWSEHTTPAGALDVVLATALASRWLAVGELYAAGSEHPVVHSLRSLGRLLERREVAERPLYTALAVFRSDYLGHVALPIHPS